MRRWLMTIVAVAIVVGAPIVGLSACSGSGLATAATTTTVPEALWIGQARVWLSAHSASLSDVSAAAKNLGDAAQAGSNNLTQIAVEDMLVKVGLADGTLPDNSFGHDMHQVFVEYATALGTIRRGILTNDQATFKAGADALAQAVADFGKITTRMGATP